MCHYLRYERKYLEIFYPERDISKHHKTPTTSEIAKQFGIPDTEVVYAMDSSIKPISLYSLVGDENGKEQYLIDKIEDDKPIDKQLDNELLYKIIRELPVREKKIIILK